MIKTAQKLVKKGDRFIAQYGVKEFHKKAADLLADGSMAQAYDYQQLVTESFKPSFHRHTQNFEGFEFSDLPITLARGENCFIDIYFWRRRPTVIHNHHFVGAFQCLHGSNLDLEFQFKEKKKIGKYHAMGEVKLLQSHFLQKGDIQAIAPLDKFIHQNHHHADLTVNLCFRTGDIKKNSLSNYLFSGLRYEKNPLLLGRVERLLRFTNLEKFSFKELDLTLDDAMYFLIRTDGSTSQNKNFLNLKSHFEKMVKKDTGLSITRLFDQHEAELEKIQELYD